MKKADVKADDILSAKSEEELTKPFLGKVEKIYENSALLKIIDYDPTDKTAVSDLNQKIVVNFKNLKSVPKKKIKRTLEVKDAREVLIQQESRKLIDYDSLYQKAIERTANNGIIFIDEIDKITAGNKKTSGEV